MDFDAFTAGVKPGGLNSRSEIKIFICYLLSAVNTPLTREQFNEISQNTSLMNYFELNDILTELQNNKTVIFENDTYRISDEGKSVAATLETEIPITVRNSAVNYAVEMLSKIKREKENKAVIEKTNGGYYVILSILDSDGELLRTSVFVTDILQAEALKENFLKNPGLLYKSVIESLVKK